MSKNKEKAYINRYGRSIIFTKKEDGSVLVSGDFGKFYRVIGFSESEQGVKAFDPEGGPFISVGVSINHYTGWKDNRVIKSIHIKENAIILNF